ncbi:glycoside hydrolase family protein [Luteimonas sp. SDU101]|uniref:glycoside hydrolase family protein n=1 Tax=Luteimonas sp. SDU101 TaxID=3422593 RepID=UPI003EBB4A41
MEVRELEQAEYERKLRTVIAGTEGLHAQVQDVGDGRATIGWGYTLNRNNNVEIWMRSGIELTPAQRATLERVDQAPRGDKTRIGMGFDRTLTEAESDRLFAASLQEYEGPAVSAGLPLSDERVALVSVTYNRGVGALRDHPLVDVLRDEDRAEAWYQLRYNCWGSREDMEGGLRKRRFAESEILGLYDDPANVGVQEAAGVYAMYRTHRLEIDRVERAFGVAIDGTRARPDRIAQANRDYPDVVAEYGNIRTLRESLAPARIVLLEHLRERYPGQAHAFTEDTFDAGEIDLRRFPVHVEGHARHGEQPLRNPADRGGEQDGTAERHGAAEPDAGRFTDPDLNRLAFAVAAGDAADADRMLMELLRAPRGVAFLESGQERLASQESRDRATPGGEAREPLTQT